LYTILSAQNISKGDQYIRNKVDGSYQWGRYRTNNSELGMRLFVSLKRGAPIKGRPANTTQNTLMVLKEKKVKYRISIGGQVYEQKRPQYIIPQVDSFSVKGRKTLLTGQIGLEAEIQFRKNNLWGTVAGIGYGSILGTLIFKSDQDFPSNKVPINYEHDFLFGHYGSVNLGLSRRFAIGKAEFAHRLSATGILLLPSENVYMGVPLETDSAPFPPFINPVLEGKVTYNGTFLVGGEYNPEVYFKLKKQYFLALGLVINYTYDVAAYGEFIVTNKHTTYYGSIVQEFSKIGISARFGLQK
jgi:hypothetical protein